MKLISCLALAATLTAGLLIGVSGCSEAPKNISKSAMIVGSGSGSLSYNPTQPGTVTVYNNTWDKIVYTGQVEPNKPLRVDAENNRISIGDRTVSERNLGNWDQYRIYFEPSPTGSARE